MKKITLTLVTLLFAGLPAFSSYVHIKANKGLKEISLALNSEDASEARKDIVFDSEKGDEPLTEALSIDVYWRGDRIATIGNVARFPKDVYFTLKKGDYTFWMYVKKFTPCEGSHKSLWERAVDFVTGETVECFTKEGFDLLAIDIDDVVYNGKSVIEQ